MDSERETNEMIRALNKQCDRICKSGNCDIECGSIGYCSAVWAAYWSDETADESGVFGKLLKRVRQLINFGG